MKETFYGPHGTLHQLQWSQIAVDSRYRDFAYLKYPLISKWKSGPGLNIKI